MSEELLSALLDGECTPGEIKRLLDQFESTPALRQRWSRMCLVRDVAENIRVPAASLDLCASVMAAIERDARPHPKVVPLTRAAAPPGVSKAAASRRSAARRWQPLAGLAMAASIAAVVTVGGYRWLSQPVGAPDATGHGGDASLASSLPVRNTSAAPQNSPLVQVSTNSGSTEPAETRWSQLDADTARQLSEYMMEHSNMRAEQGVGGALSDPRMVRTVEYRADEQH